MGEGVIGSPTDYAGIKYYTDTIVDNQRRVTEGGRQRLLCTGIIIIKNKYYHNTQW